MSNVKIEFDTNKLSRNLEKILNRIINEENRKVRVQKAFNERSENMFILNGTEKELLKLILESNCAKDGYTYSGTIEKFPEYISVQLKKLFEILEDSGYAAQPYVWITGGWQICITPEGQKYFENEGKYKEMNNKSNINIGTIQTNGGFVNFGTANNINYTVDNSYNELSNQIDKNADESDKKEMKKLMEELKEYLSNTSKTQSISTNKSLFKKLGNHFTKYQWFYQCIVNIVGQSILAVMSGK